MAVSDSVVLYEPTETSLEVVTAAGFLAGYSGRTREAYTLDLRQFIRWCDEHRLGLFDVTRIAAGAVGSSAPAPVAPRWWRLTHIELYARELEELGRAPATIGRRLSTLAGFYRYATEEGVMEHSPAVHVRRPKLDYESHAVGDIAAGAGNADALRDLTWAATTSYSTTSDEREVPSRATIDRSTMACAMADSRRRDDRP